MPVHHSRNEPESSREKLSVSEALPLRVERLLLKRSAEESCAFAPNDAEIA